MSSNLDRLFYKGLLEPDCVPEPGCTIELLMTTSIAISLKRIADAHEKAVLMATHFSSGKDDAKMGNP